MFPEYFDSGMQSIDVHGILLGSLAQWIPDERFAIWQIGTAEGRLDIVVPSSDMSHNLIVKDLQPQRFDLIRWDREDGRIDAPILHDARPLHEGFGTHYLPPDYCPIGGVVADAIELIHSIATDPLRRFVHAVFEDRFVCNHFWTMPASMRHHHAYPGGLAQHSVEVAQDVATQGRLTDLERDLGIAGGLLHDIGKVWAYTADTFMSNEGLAMGHELTGLTRLAPQLRELRDYWADGAYAMSVLLSGCARMRPDGSMPSALVARIRACDQRSCERSGGPSTRPGRSWMPKVYQPI
ncbi:MAG: TraI domain-containing protein [Gemmatimonadaceae bacterium]